MLVIVTEGKPLTVPEHLLPHIPFDLGAENMAPVVKEISTKRLKHDQYGKDQPGL